MEKPKYGNLKTRAHLLNDGERQHFDSTELKMSSESSAQTRLNAGKEGTVLLVADDLSRRMASIVLTRGNFRVELAESVDKLTTMVSQKRFDAILISEEVPKLGAAVDLVRIIRSQEQEKGLQPSLVLGLVQAAHACDIFKEAGMNGVVFKGSQLLPAVQQAMSAFAQNPHDFTLIRS